MSDWNKEQEERYFELLNMVPTDKELDAYPQLTMHKLKKRKLRNKRLRNTLIVAAILMLSFAGSIRFSPQFAQAVYQIPLLKPLVNMIAYDKGVEDILENEYVEEINKSQTIDGKTLTITGVIADYSGMIISYKLESDEDLSKFFGIQPTVLQDGDFMVAAVGSSWYALQEGTFEVENTIEVSASQEMDYSSHDFIVQVSLSDRPDIQFEIPFTLQNEIKLSQRFDIHKEVEVDGQKFTVEALIISPLRSQLVLSINKNNRKQILHFGTISLYDEHGEAWGKIRNGISGAGSYDDDTFIIMLQSNYFRVPEAITIEFENIEAIEKNAESIEVDFEQKKVLNMSYSNIDMTVNNELEIEYKSFYYNENEHRMYFDEAIDADGVVYRFNYATVSQNDGYQMITQRIDTELSEKPIKNPVKLQFSRFEKVLDGVGVVEVKLK